MNLTGNTILITGGGTGIGRALAQRFHDLGNVVIVAGRRQETLDEAIAGRADMHAIVVDVDDAAELERFVTRLLADFPALNILLNNAGIMRNEDLTKTRDLADAEATMTTNLLAPIRLTNALAGHLAARPAPVIVNVSSGLGFVPLIATPTYSATKAAIHSYTVSLREQLRGKIEVIEIVPPAVQTELTPGQSDREGYLPLAEFSDEVIALFQQRPTPAEICVDRVGFLRRAEQEGRFDAALAAVNAH